MTSSNVVACSTLGLAHLSRLLLHLAHGDWTKARVASEQIIAILRTANVPFLLPAPVVYSAHILAQLGEMSAALNRLQEGEQLIEGLAAKGIVGHTAWAYCVLGRASLLLGRLDQARSLCIRVVESFVSQPGNIASALRLLGDIASHPDRFDAESAEANYRKALALAEPRGMRPLIAHCHLGLGKLYRRTGRRQEAQEHLSTAKTMYSEMGITYWLEQAEAEIRALA